MIPNDNVILVFLFVVLVNVARNNAVVLLKSSFYIVMLIQTISGLSFVKVKVRYIDVSVVRSVSMAACNDSLICPVAS